MDDFTFVAYASVRAVEPFIMDSNLEDNMRFSVSTFHLISVHEINIFLVTIATYLSPNHFWKCEILQVKCQIDLLCRNSKTYALSCEKDTEMWLCIFVHHPYLTF